MNNAFPKSAAAIAGVGLLIALLVLSFSWEEDNRGATEVSEGGDPGGKFSESRRARFSIPDTGGTHLGGDRAGSRVPEGGADGEGIEWGGQSFPSFVQLPAELGEAYVLACDEVVLDNGCSLRLTLLTAENTGDKPLLFVELGDGYGGVARRGLFDPTFVKIDHRPEDNGAVFHRLAAIGLGEQSMSSTYDEQLSVQAPSNPMLILEFLGAVQGHLGQAGKAQLVPVRPEWGDLLPSHGDRYVRLD